jgi:hypothetical protein
MLPTAAADGGHTTPSSSPLAVDVKQWPLYQLHAL